VSRQPARDIKARSITQESTIADAKAYMRERVDEGVDCVVCRQFVRRYRRRLHAGQARWLIELVRLYQLQSTWIHFAEVNGTLDYAKLRDWGLIESKPNDDTTKKDSGYWRPTQLGIDFVYDRESVPSHGVFYNRRCYRLDDSKLITIRQALGKKFVYPELMARLPKRK